MSALEEQLRESACYGDVDAMTSLLQSGVNVNSANSMNGWTALHWACKRGHVKCKNLLISWGASTETLNKKGESPLSLEPKRNSFSRSDSYCLETNVDNAVSNDKNSLGFIPNYLQYPEFNHKIETPNSLANEKENYDSHEKSDN